MIWMWIILSMKLKKTYSRGPTETDVWIIHSPISTRMFVSLLKHIFRSTPSDTVRHHQTSTPSDTNKRRHHQTPIDIETIRHHQTSIPSDTIRHRHRQTQCLIRRRHTFRCRHHHAPSGTIRHHQTSTPSDTTSHKTPTHHQTSTPSDTVRHHSTPSDIDIVRHNVS